jgi:hypothetical protein
MKESVFFDDEFEKQLKEKADQFKMYPSDKVWNRVHSSLHSRRRRFVAGMTFLIGSILVLAGSQLIFPTRNIPAQTVAAKMDVPAKPAETAVVPGFTPNTFATDPNENFREPHPSNHSLGKAVPSLLIHSRYSSTLQPGPGEMQEAIPQKLISTLPAKTIQPEEVNKPGEKAAQFNVLDGFENRQSLPEMATDYSESDVPAPGKSGTRAGHNHSDRFSWEIYMAPTLNTHYLNGLNYQTIAQSIQSSPIMVVHVANVNGFVDNTPVMGFDVGGNILYRISKNISLKLGLDFSLNRYYIKAYNSNQPQATATLSSYLGYIADSLVNPNTGSGINKNPQHYENRYYQLSLPVGVDMKVAGNGKLQLHLGATLQPSYLLNTDAYVLSGDYNSYTKDAQAFRRWNLIAGAEAYLSYRVGKIRWELGPQMRYQIFSVYKNSYPLQENMLNYGIRIGISKSIR